jgi:hypothetical protein
MFRSEQDRNRSKCSYRCRLVTVEKNSVGENNEEFYKFPLEREPPRLPLIYLAPFLPDVNPLMLVP